MKLTVICIDCKKPQVVENLSLEQIEAIHAGEKHIQHILPDHSPEDRELFITQMCPKCWDELFKDEEEEGGTYHFPDLK